MSQAPSADLSAIIRFTKGPEKGQVFELREELVHLGRGEENHFRLAEKSLEEHELSIVLRNGRYAIYAAREETIAVDGNLLPAEKWVWLPEQASVGVGKKTEFDFQINDKAGGSAPVEPPQQSSKPAKVDRPSSGGTAQPKSMPVPKVKASKKSSPDASRKSGTQPGKRKKAVARFITDSVGDPLVKLGEDGNFPELTLEEVAGESRKKNKTADPQKKEGGSMLLYLALGFSFISSTLMLVFDFEIGGGTAVNKAEARREIQQFYGGEREQLEDYQLLLREAALAHSRGDTREERNYYRRVLTMLIAEDNQGFIRLTDTKESDEKLRDLLAILLSN